MNQTAKKLAELGKSDAQLLDRQNKLLIKLNDTHLALEANRKERCELLTGAATSQGPTLGLTADVIATATEPKDE
jgi:hypothetical protein